MSKPAPIRARSLAPVASLLMACAALVAVSSPGEAHAPTLAPAATADRRAAGAQKVRLKATRPKPVAAGATVRSKVTLVNRTRKTLKHVKIKTKVSGSATVKPRVKKVKRVRQGHKVRFRLKLVAGNERVAKVKVIAKVRGKKVATTRFKLRTKPGTQAPASLVGRYFFYKGATTSAGDKELYFGDGFANSDVPEQAYVPCSAATADCLAYAYDAGTGALTVGGEQGVATPGGTGLTLGGLTYQEAAMQPPGARYAVNLSTSYMNSSCPFYGCFSYSSDLILGADGSYEESISNNIGGYAHYRGTYEVISDSRVWLRYVDDDGASGEKIKTIGVVLDAAGNPSPGIDGIVLGGAWYFPGG